MSSVRVKLDGDRSYMTGRNGTYRLAELTIYATDDWDMVSIDGIGRRGTLLNGGFYINKEPFIKAIIDFLGQNGYSVTKKEEK